MHAVVEIVHGQEPEGFSLPGVAPNPQAQGAGILLVDDNESLRSMMALLLGQHGFLVWQAADGYEACEVYRSQQEDIDLVLMDVCMPRLDGPQALAALREIDREVRCCFMSAGSGRYTETELLQRGALQFFRKPFMPSRVCSALRQLVGALAAF
jgi:two-component system cell cycle sensor histidine kinase/response regulator CckA